LPGLNRIAFGVEFTLAGRERLQLRDDRRGGVRIVNHFQRPAEVRPLAINLRDRAPDSGQIGVRGSLVRSFSTSSAITSGHVMIVFIFVHTAVSNFFALIAKAGQS
jgi:hypothetical protein